MITAKDGSARPIRVAIVNDYELVVAGVAGLLEPYADRVRVVELDSRMPVKSPVDVILYDTFGQAQANLLDVATLAATPGAHLVVFSWNLDESLVRDSLSRGARGYVGKGTSGPALVAALERVAAGEVVQPDTDVAPDETVGEWPGREQGLTARESEVIALIAQGLSNKEIADRAYLSINSVKTYIRTAYRKMGVERRSQAVIWGMRHGFDPDRLRVIDPGTDASDPGARLGREAHRRSPGGTHPGHPVHPDAGRQPRGA